MRLIIVRHGETIENLQGICQGQMDGTLSPNGLIQVKLIAERLQNEQIDVIFSSDLKRALDTTNEIHKYHQNAPLIVEKRLRERYFGDFQGKYFPKNKKEQFLPTSAENDGALHNRVRDFYEDVLSKYFEQSVLIVSHGVTIRMILVVIQNRIPSSIHSIDELRNGSITIIEISSFESLKIHLYNSIEHLCI